MSSEEDWSDSDSEFEEEQKGDVATSVFLGIPDGPLTSAYDDADAAVSRAGGLPPFLRLKEYPSPDVSLCKRCNLPMEMLVSIFCPFEGSSNDRVLYVWGCARAECQRKDGSVRAYRSLCHNAKYAAKLERQRARKAAQSSAPEKPAAPKSGTNPFSRAVPASDQVVAPSGLGDLLFAANSSNCDHPDSCGWGEASDSNSATDEEDDEEEESPEEELAEEDSGTQARGEPNPDWALQPSYRSLYISTVEEYINAKPPPPVSKKAINEAQTSTDTGGAPWGKESYEVMHKLDDIFEKFVARVQEEPQQVLRYDLSGTPLPFSSRDAVYKRLFPVQPIAPGTAVPINGPTPPVKHAYDPSVLDPCPRCGGSRVFEAQLVPNLINILQRRDPPSSNKKQSAEERQQELEALLRGKTDGMEWGTVMVFSCLADCSVDSAGVQCSETWVEELVAVQWDV
ncbi:hypothetical protein CALCODRAFT_370547 [Calocera cornea HHB12733]|uniref:Programmed cell death protein 2 C-terminal domain-containing protein n=1 Tax=Calocera cornea HHB12733 TaxID=1353952 RepID=A0A165EIR6_9BASI|nr:hypothetical protein CALCODRAFT_370547 [Calocera cornea HHB12733]